MTKQTPSVEVLPIEQGATPDLQNVNKHTQRGRGLHENSMRKRGAGRSIFSAGKGVEVPVVMGGNQTLEIAATLGMEVINVHTTGNQIVNVVRDDIEPGSPEFYALGIEDNEIGKLSYAPDVDQLAALAAADDAVLAQLRNEDKIFGGMLEGMGIKNETVDAEPQIDRAAELQDKWQTAIGQLWKLGNHRLLIGDCTVRENVERLMGGETASLAPVDPPYNVGFEYDGETVDDTKTEEKYKEFCIAWFGECQRISEKQIVTPGCYNLASWMRWFDAYHWTPWVKTNAMTNGKVSRFLCWEPMLFFGKTWKRSRSNDIFDFPVQPQKMSNNGETLSGLHPCPKPLGMWEDLIENYSELNDIIYECFGGSGTTLMACVNKSRLCRIMEISPAYGAVILERFYTATGITPELVE
jgi:hypothetical protein